jgi:hypothetical protein
VTADEQYLEAGHARIAKCRKQCIPNKGAVVMPQDMYVRSSTGVLLYTTGEDSEKRETRMPMSIVQMANGVVSCASDVEMSGLDFMRLKIRRELAVRFALPAAGGSKGARVRGCD